MKPRLIIIRGVPGTGKSTLAHKMRSDIENSVVLEADMYFCADSGFYKFDHEKLHQAHNWCLTTMKVMLRNGYNVIVSNTFTTLKEIQPYVDFAKELWIPFTIITLDEEYGSVHNVPETSMIRMRERFIPHHKLMELVNSDLQLA